MNLQLYLGTFTLTRCCIIFVLFIVSLYSIGFIKGISATIPTLFPIDSSPYGTSYPEWTAKWWQWVISIPKQDNPNLDVTGEKCGIMQTDPNVMFLAPTFGGSAERDCDIPQGKAILVPILTGECDHLSDPAIKTESGLKQCALSVNEGGVVKASLDGTSISNISRYRVQSPLFEFTIPADNAFGEGPTGTTKAIADGYWIFLKPLTPGRHQLEFSGDVIDLMGQNSYATAVKYNLGVVP